MLKSQEILQCESVWFRTHCNTVIKKAVDYNGVGIQDLPNVLGPLIFFEKVKLEYDLYKSCGELD